MLSVIYGAGLFGTDGYVVTVECNSANKLPAFEIVGMPDIAVKEAKERVVAAADNSGIHFPDTEIIVNLAPADRKKTGSSFDLAILVAVLCCSGDIQTEHTDGFSDCCFIGELSLTGEVKGVNGVLSMVLGAIAGGKRRIFVPESNSSEASIAAMSYNNFGQADNSIKIYGVKDMRSLVIHLSGGPQIPEAHFDMSVFRDSISNDEISCYDMSNVIGQEQIKRALEIAAAGGHNILMIGPPGTGKSMLAKRLPTILPEMTFKEAVETTKVYSASDLLRGSPVITRRPFRSPHHTMSSVSLVGGGANPMPGEISLAHNGVLFLDELPEFGKQTAEVLRQPLEDREVTISRASGRVTFPCRFMLVCAMNPCKCGYYGSKTHECSCRKSEIKNYMSKISGPLLDRIDIQVEVHELPFGKLSSPVKGESSAKVRERVNMARKFAAKRFADNKAEIYSNSEMSSEHIRKFCSLNDESKTMLNSVYDRLGLSARGYDRILRLARTIADLAQSEEIQTEHLAEAIQLRVLDRKYW